MLTQNFGALRKYVPAELKHNKKGWYIEYYKFNPIINNIERTRIMLNRERNRCKTQTEFKLQTNAMLLQINNQLASGMTNLQSPMFSINGTNGIDDYASGDNIRYYTPLTQVIALYEEDRSHELSVNTMRSYSCCCFRYSS